MSGWMFWPWIIIAIIAGVIWLIAALACIGQAWSDIWDKRPMKVSDYRQIFAILVLGPPAIFFWPITLVILIIYPLIKITQAAAPHEMDFSPKGLHGLFSDGTDGTRPSILALEAAEPKEEVDLADYMNKDSR